MKRIQAWLNRPKHKYSIHARLLGDANNCAWTNLGYWDSKPFISEVAVCQTSYQQACERLAVSLANTVQLKAEDKLLDLGCGRGASLLLWKEKYRIEYLEAIEIQKHCIEQNLKYLPMVNKIHQGSFLNLDAINFKNKFDVILCIDAAYHSDLSDFIKSVNSVLASSGRVGFHYLMLSDRYEKISKFEKIKLKWLLKAADVDMNHLKTEKEIENQMYDFEFRNIQCSDLSQEVFLGFSNYIASDEFIKNIKQTEHHFIDLKKIQLTAKLCAQLYKQDVVKYVQVTAHK